MFKQIKQVNFFHVIIMKFTFVMNQIGIEGSI